MRHLLPLSELSALGVSLHGFDDHSSSSLTSSAPGVSPRECDCHQFYLVSLLSSLKPKWLSGHPSVEDAPAPSEAAALGVGSHDPFFFEHVALKSACSDTLTVLFGAPGVAPRDERISFLLSHRHFRSPNFTFIFCAGLLANFSNFLIVSSECPLLSMDRR